MEYLTLIGIFSYGIGYFFYIKKSFQGNIQPNRVSWILRGVSCLIAAFVAFSKGSWRAAVPTFIAGVASLVVFVSTFFSKKAYRKLWIFDYACGFFSILALVLRAITKQAEVAIIFAMMSDFSAAIPTLKKSYQHPETENISGFLPWWINISTSFFAIKSVSFASLAFPLYVFVLNSLFIVLILRRQKTKNLQTR